MDTTLNTLGLQMGKLQLQTMPNILRIDPTKLGLEVSTKSSLQVSKHNDMFKIESMRNFELSCMTP